MKTVLVCAVLLLFAGEVGAGEYKPNELCMSGPTLDQKSMVEIPCPPSEIEDMKRKMQNYSEQQPITIPNGHYRGTFTEKNLDKLLAGEDPCLAQMEAAMRAMEPWLSRWHISGDGNMTWMDDRRIDSETMLPLTFSSDPNDPSMKKYFDEQEAVRLKAFALWEAAKQCWREP